MTGPDLLERIDRAIAELEALRAELMAALPAEGNGADADDDLAPERLLDTTSASARFGYPRDTIAKWCREGCGVKRGGRWLVSTPRLRRRLNGC